MRWKATWARRNACLKSWFVKGWQRLYGKERLCSRLHDYHINKIRPMFPFLVSCWILQRVQTPWVSVHHDRHGIVIESSDTDRHEIMIWDSLYQLFVYPFHLVNVGLGFSKIESFFTYSRLIVLIREFRVTNFSTDSWNLLSRSI